MYSRVIINNHCSVKELLTGQLKSTIPHRCSLILSRRLKLKICSCVLQEVHNAIDFSKSMPYIGHKIQSLAHLRINFDVAVISGP